jgi:hypothetical protein
MLQGFGGRTGWWQCGILRLAPQAHHPAPMVVLKGPVLFQESGSSQEVSRGGPTGIAARNECQTLIKFYIFVNERLFSDDY